MTRCFNAIKVLAMCTVGAALLSGCATIHKLPLQEIAFAQEQIDSMHNDLIARHNELMAEHVKLQAEQKRLMEELNSNTEMLRLLRADQVVRFSSIDNTVRAISDNVFESQSKLRNLDRQTSEVKRSIEQQIAQSEDAATQREQNDFNIAKSDFDAGLFDMAQRGFVTFIKNFPNSNRMVEAKYWIAECHYARKEFEDAVREYMAFIRDHQDSDKYCVSLYKLGLAYDALKRVKNRDAVWKTLAERCPDSQEAQAAKAAQAVGQ